MSKATDFGKEIVISDNKSIEGATIETSETSDVDSEISTKYTYKLDIGGNVVFVTIYENAIDSVKDSDGNPLSASGDNYTVGTINFALALDNGIPNVTYDGTSSAAAVLDTTTYSFSVDSKPVEVVVQNDAITKVSVDSAQVGTAAGTYSVGTQKLKLSYANGSLTAQNASSVSPTISSVATYTVGDTTVTVDSSGQLSQTTATVNGQTATLTYSADTKKITASYTVSTSGNSGTYTVTLPDDSTVTVKVENGAISSVTYDDKEITATEGKYSVTTTGGTNYALSLNYTDSNLTATTTTTIDELTATSDYTVAFGDDSITITVKDNKLYQGTTELSATNDVYTVTVGSKEVKLKYDATNGLQTLINVVDLSTLTADYEAQDGDILTGATTNYKISIADGATVTLSGVNINVTGIEAAGIACNGSANIILEGTDTVVASDGHAGIQAGGTGTKLTIEGIGSLEATGGSGGAGIGADDQSTCGDIEIKGGNVSATGGYYGAGIGSGYADEGNSTCSDIEIKGGNVSATGGSRGVGIGSGYTYKGTNECGKIVIENGNVSANGGENAAGIGSGYAEEGGNNTCGNIEIKGGTVTATGNDGGAGIGAGYVNGGGTNTCGDITITNDVTKVTATKGEYATNAIGKGYHGSTIGIVTTPSGTGAQTDNYTYTGKNMTDLSTLNGDYVAQDGDILTGTTSCKISIADGATVTLCDVTINGTSAAGITCLGNATIILEGTNTVTGTDECAGIQAGGTGTTLTIKGTGSLDATGGMFAAGIGSNAVSYSYDEEYDEDIYVDSTCGNIVIESGTVTATGSDSSAGIGSGYTYYGTSKCGDIEIKGGTVTATGSDSSAGIGAGYSERGTTICGDIEIKGGTVTATGGDYGGGAGIGSGGSEGGSEGNNTCGDITITNDVTKVTATKGEDATNSIGKGYNGSTIGTVTTPSGTGAQTDNYTYTGKNMTDLSTLNGDYVAQDGDILTGTTSCKISIADGATVTLCDVTIDGNYAAGITCNGSATIILEGTNTVTGADEYAGIQAGGTGTTLTITGTGSLEATGGQYGAAIGSGKDISCGNIVIESGTVTAQGGNYAAGIGSGNGSANQNNSTCGNIEIKGGTVTAQGGNYAAGIGSGNGSANQNNSTCGNIEIKGGNITATGGTASAGIGSGNANSGNISQCGAITISGGSVTAIGNSNAVGIGSGYVWSDGGESNCGTVTITDGVTKVTATKGSDSSKSIGASGVEGKSTCGTVTIGGEVGEKSDDKYTYEPGGAVVDISTTTTQTATINGTTVTFTTDSTGAIKYTVGNGEETTATIIDNTFTFKVDNTDVTATVADGKVTKLSCETYDSATITKLEPVTITYEHTATLYTFAINGNDISVSVDSDGNITYNAQAVTDNKITVDGKEVTLTVSDGKITGASYFGEYSTVTEIEQVDVYKVTIDGQEVSCTFDTNNQCTVKVGEKNYLVTKTTNGATITSTVAAVGTEDSRAYLLAVGDGNYLISCTFDGSGNVTAVASDDTALSIIGTTIKIGDYTINISGTKDNLTTAATLKTTSESVEDVEVKQAFVLTGVKSTDGITVSDNVVTLTEANLNSQKVTLTGDGYTLALDKNYSATTIAPHFDGMTYKSAGTSEGYELSNNAKSISYVSETTATDLFTLTGVKSTDGITVADNVVTLTEANLNSQDVTIAGDGYTLALDKNYSATTIAPHFDGMTYKSASTSGSYELSNNAKSINYVSGTTATDLFTLTGVKSTDGITVSDNVVTLTEANLNSQDVTIAGDGYTLSLAEGINEPTFNAGGWTLSGTTATYTGASNSEGYTLSDDAKTVTYTGANDEGISLKVYGVKSTDGITVSDNVVTLTEANLNSQDVTIAGDDYTLALLW